MADHDYKKLQAFVEAALTNPKHPIYSIGYAKSPILQHYATNVTLLQAVNPEQWFREYQTWTDKIEEAIKILETPEPAPVAEAEKPATPEPVTEAPQQIEEAAMKVKCPKCGETFSVPMKGA